MFENEKGPSPIPPSTPTDEWLKEQQHQAQQASQVRDRDCGGMRALTSLEMHHIEKCRAEELHACVRSFVAFPTLENFQRIQTASSAYITAWMNGRRRILD